MSLIQGRNTWRNSELILAKHGEGVWEHLFPSKELKAASSLRLRSGRETLHLPSFNFSFCFIVIIWIVLSCLVESWAVNNLIN